VTTTETISTWIQMG